MVYYAPIKYSIVNGVRVPYPDSQQWKPTNNPNNESVVYIDNQGRTTGKTSNPNITVPSGVSVRPEQNSKIIGTFADDLNNTNVSPTQLKVLSQLNTQGLIQSHTSYSNIPNVSNDNFNNLNVSPTELKVLNQLNSQGKIISYSTFVPEPKAKPLSYWESINEQGIFKGSIDFATDTSSNALESSKQFIIKNTGKYGDDFRDFFYSGFDLTTKQPRTFSRSEVMAQDKAVSEGFLFVGLPELFLGRGMETIANEYSSVGTKRTKINENIKSYMDEGINPIEANIMGYGEPALDIAFGTLGTYVQVKGVDTMIKNSNIEKFESTKTKIDVTRIEDQMGNALDIINAEKGYKNINFKFEGQQPVKYFLDNIKFEEPIGNEGALFESGKPAVKLGELNLKDQAFLEGGKGKAILSMKNGDGLDFIYTEVKTGGRIKQFESIPELKTSNKELGITINTELPEFSSGVGRTFVETTGRVRGKVAISPKSSFVDIGGQDLRYLANLEKEEINLGVKKYKTSGGITKELRGQENILVGLGLDKIDIDGGIFVGKQTSIIRIRRIEVGTNTESDSFMFGNKKGPSSRSLDISEEDISKIMKDESLLNQKSLQKQEQKTYSPKGTANYYDSFVQNILDDVMPKRSQVERPKPITISSEFEEVKTGQRASVFVSTRDDIILREQTVFKGSFKERSLNNVRNDYSFKEAEMLREKDLFNLKTETKQVQQQRNRMFNPIIDIPRFKEPEIKVPFFSFKLNGNSNQRKSKIRTSRSNDLVYTEDFTSSILGIRKKTSKKQLLKETMKGDFGIGLREIPEFD